MAALITINGDVFGDLSISGDNANFMNTAWLGEYQPPQVPANQPAPDPANQQAQVPINPLPPIPQQATTRPRRLRRRRQHRQLRPRVGTPVQAPPRQAQRPRHLRGCSGRVERLPLPTLHQDPIFWYKVANLPSKFLDFLTPTCDLHSFTTTCQYLRDIILYFNPGHQISLRILKLELIELFKELVVRPFGRVYGI